MGSFAEFERALIRERQREGVALAKARGIYKGRKRSLTAEQVEQLRGRVAAGEKKPSWRVSSVSRETVHRYLRKPATPARVPDSLPQMSQELEEIA